jgi:hypothetical protein
MLIIKTKREIMFIKNFKFSNLPVSFYILISILFLFTLNLKFYLNKVIEKEKIQKEIKKNESILKNQKSLAEDVIRQKWNCIDIELYAQNEKKPLSNEKIESCEEIFKINVYMDKYNNYRFGNEPKYFKGY